jgi:hypothetical protein
MDGNCLTLRGRKVRVDDKGLVSLDDIFSVANRPNGKSPFAWYRGSGRSAFVLAAHNRVGGTEGGKVRISDVLRMGSAENGGWWAHPIIAASYAGHLNPVLEVEVHEVWLRYKAGDETLADEVRNNRRKKDERWVRARHLGIDRRKDYTASLADHGVVEGKDFARCTNAAYRSLFGAPASALKAQRKVPAKASLRDTMTSSELSFLAAAETLSAERIEDENPNGADACAKATSKSSDRIRQAIEADRADRTRSLFGGAESDA